MHDGYDDLLADPDIEVVYNRLANALHAPWNLRVIAAGKHVLAEKPFASNAIEARQIAAAAKAAGLVVLEAFHCPFHPLFQRACAPRAGSGRRDPSRGGRTAHAGARGL